MTRACIAAFVAGAAACSGDVSPGTVPCHTDQECPTGWYCAQVTPAEGRCFLAAQACESDPDFHAPCSPGGDACGGRYECADDGAHLVCSGQQVSDEVCDGIDNDCDGLTDDDLESGAPLAESCYGGADGTEGVGACRAGTTTCAQGQLGACEGEVRPGPELCDGADNDCDGRVDDGSGNQQRLEQECYRGPVETLGWGVCHAGTQSCSEGGWATCEGDVTPSEEVCDGKDNDCDGQTDEGFAPLTCGLGECQVTVAGCDAGVPHACVPRGAAPEVCEGAHDEDCDGVIDNGCACTDGQTLFCYTGAPATRNVGECHGGLQTCRGGRWSGCEGQVVPALAEVCNGRDDDCDGRTDNSPGTAEALAQTCYTGTAETRGVGACHGGFQTCAAGSWGACGGQVLPTAEICDGYDNDCDGRANEDLAPPACGLGAGVCAGAKKVCGGDRGWLECDGAQYGTDYEASETLCDGKDNDCDGRTDEDLVGPRCELKLGVCAPARKACGGTAGWMVCDAARYGPEYEASETRCDGKDNDCDGQTDEEMGIIACGVGECARSVAACAGGQPQSCVPGTPSPEICDGKDDDCDGKTDAQDNKLVLTACEKSGGVCAGKLHAASQCTGSGWTACGAAEYGADYEAVETRCDGKDNDCDGAADGSDANLAPAPCEKTAGVCAGKAHAPAQCTAAGWSACTAAEYGADYEAAESRCDGKDNDCDSAVDGADADLVTPPCEKTVGVCAGALHAAAQCTASGWAACTAAEYGAEYEAAETRCDARDNDCDGAADNGLPAPSAPVAVALPAAADLGTRCLAWMGAGYHLGWLTRGDPAARDPQLAQLDETGALRSNRALVLDAVEQTVPDLIGVSSDSALVFTDTFFSPPRISFSQSGSTPIDTFVAGWDPSLAWAPKISRFGLVSREGDGTSVTFALLFELTGTRASPPLTWSGLTGAGRPRVAWSDTEFAAVFVSGGNVLMARVKNDGSEAAPPAVVSTAAQSPPLVAWDGAGWGVAWSDARSGTLAPWFARLDSSGQRLGADVQLAQYGTVIGRAWNGFLYAFVINDAGVLKLLRAARDGTPLGEAVTFAASADLPCGPVWTGAQFAAAWSTGGQVSFRGLGCSGL